MKTSRVNSAKPASHSRSASRRARAKNTASSPTTRKAPSRTRRSAAPATAEPPAHHEESEAKTTTDLNEIRAWAQKRGGKPVTVKGTAPEHEAGLLRIDFPGYSGEDTLEEIAWDEWYAKFEDKKLAFLYQEKTKDGEESRFFKLVERK